MPVMDNETHKSLVSELDTRWRNLSNLLQSRKLKSPTEGCKTTKRGRWNWEYPETKCATVGSAFEIRMAVEDFKTILSELKRLK